MLFHVGPGNPVRDTLKAKRCKEPIENRRRIARGNSLIQTRLTNLAVDLIQKRQGSRECTDTADQSVGVFVGVRKVVGRSSLPCRLLPQRSWGTWTGS